MSAEKDWSKTPIIASTVENIINAEIQMDAFLAADALAIALIGERADPSVIFSVAAGLEGAVARLVAHLSTDQHAADALLDVLHGGAESLVAQHIERRGEPPAERMNAARKWGAG